MKKAVYIGINTPGTTSNMRALHLKAVLKDWEVDVIDTDIPFKNSGKLVRSLGFRYKLGPLINRINNYILQNLDNAGYQLIWVDKAIYITPETTKLLKEKCQTLIHYTPDTAFYGNKSALFNHSMQYYSYLVTTKSFEKEIYKKSFPGERLIFATQGFDRNVHQPISDFREKKARVAFIGLNEPSRETVLQKLLDNQIPVALAGKKWEGFVKRNAQNSLLHYLGDDLRGDDYVRLIGESYFSIGFLSKKFPELHTTRTFEIPACGTALLTERNEEIMQFYQDDEVVYYSTSDELVNRIKEFEKFPEKLEAVTRKGFHRVTTGNYEYSTIIKNILDKAIR